jgi:hypothetical protein
MVVCQHYRSTRPEQLGRSTWVLHQRLELRENFLQRAPVRQQEPQLEVHYLLLQPSYALRCMVDREWGSDLSVGLGQASVPHTLGSEP